MGTGTSERLVLLMSVATLEMVYVIVGRGDTPP